MVYSYTDASFVADVLVGKNKQLLGDYKRGKFTRKLNHDELLAADDSFVQAYITQPASEPLFGSAGALDSHPARTDAGSATQIFDDADLAGVGFVVDPALSLEDVYITNVTMAPGSSSGASQADVKNEEDTPELEDSVQPAAKRTRSMIDEEDLSPPESVY